MGDFDMSKDYQLAGAILFPMALGGLASNVCVVAFLRSMPSLSNAFGSLTFSQAVVGTIHQFFMAFYLAPTIIIHDSTMYALSEHFGYIMLTAYQVCCYSHVFISTNRFFAVCLPVTYRRLFTYCVRCPVYVPEGSWLFIFDEKTCGVTMWYWDFLVNSIIVVIVATLDITSIVRLHCMTVNLAALQGICFISELVTYFILSGYARNKWELFALTSISWCAVTGMDGLIVLVCNRDFRRHFLQLVGHLEPTATTAVSTSAHSQGNQISPAGSAVIPEHLSHL